MWIPKPNDRFKVCWNNKTSGRIYVCEKTIRDDNQPSNTKVITWDELEFYLYRFCHLGDVRFVQVLPKR